LIFYKEYKKWVFIICFLIFSISYTFPLFSNNDALSPSSRGFFTNVERSTENMELKFFPSKQRGKFALNVSIGGTKISFSLVDFNGDIYKESENFGYRNDVSLNWDKCKTFNEKREIFFELLKQKIDSFVVVDKDNILYVAVSWPGDVLEGNIVSFGGVPGFNEGAEARNTPSTKLLEIIKELFLDIDISNIMIINDGYAAALGELQVRKKKDGIVIILGSGLGGGIVKGSKPFEGGISGKESINFAQKVYRAYATDILVYSGGQDFDNLRVTGSHETLSGEALTRIFLQKLLFNDIDNVRRDSLVFDDVINEVYYYFNSKISRNVLKDFYFGVDYFSQKKYEQTILETITAKAVRGDFRAIDFIINTGKKVGQVIGGVKLHYINELFVSDFILVGGNGQNFGKGVFDKNGDDLFLQAIQEGIKQAFSLLPDIKRLQQELKERSRKERYSRLADEFSYLLKVFEYYFADKEEVDKLNLLYKRLLNPKLALSCDLGMDFKINEKELWYLILSLKDSIVENKEVDSKIKVINDYLDKKEKLDRAA
jgi:hypothetical protein